MTDKSRRLATYVHVDGKRYGPEDDVPPEVAEKITNPKVWADGDEPSALASARPRRGSSGPRLASYVHVGGRRFGPEDEVPADVAALITNPKAWEGGAPPTRVESGTTARTPEAQAPGDPPSQAAQEYEMTPEEIQALAGDDADAGDAGDSAADGDKPAQIPAPRRSGRGSGVDAWAAFAATQGVEVEADASRDEIIAACEQAGVIEADGK
ncbi:hypothetical protein [Micromonospora sp. RV43]|uniref:hypothetical protein n=1 Tax=Micromonospora sp. RV43 TaxID=1661387 RepID=UPI00069EEFF7|nr:hypothetical protein [Micromonospora sp. RV43]